MVVSWLTSIFLNDRVWFLFFIFLVFHLFLKYIYDLSAMVWPVAIFVSGLFSWKIGSNIFLTPFEENEQ